MIPNINLVIMNKKGSCGMGRQRLSVSLSGKGSLKSQIGLSGLVRSADLLSGMGNLRSERTTNKKC